MDPKIWISRVANGKLPLSTHIGIVVFSGFHTLHPTLGCPPAGLRLGLMVIRGFSGVFIRRRRT